MRFILPVILFPFWLIITGLIILLMLLTAGLGFIINAVLQALIGIITGTLKLRNKPNWRIINSAKVLSKIIDICSDIISLLSELNHYCNELFRSSYQKRN